MAEIVEELKTLAHRMMQEKWDYKSQTKKYVRQVMGYYRQEELIAALEHLTYKELKMIAGCGIPGDAWRVSVDLLKRKREEIDLLIEQHGQQATATIEPDADSGDDSDGEGRIQTP